MIIQIFLDHFGLLSLRERDPEIIYYFYSTNCHHIKHQDGRSLSVSYHYRNLNWPIYVFWNNYQQKVFKKFLEHPYSITISGPICLQNKELEENFKFPSKTISVFNIIPVRNSMYKTLGIPDEYFTPKYCLTFIKDILFICQKIILPYALNQRGIEKTTHPSYIKYINSISNKGNFMTIPDETSPFDLIKKTNISIAMPFTSTPHFSKFLKKTKLLL